MPFDIVNVDDFRTYCEHLATQEPQFQYYPLNEYVTETDFTNYQAARAWWPKDAPPALMLPDLTQFAAMRRVYPGAVMDGDTTFAAILTKLSQRCVTWLESEGRDVKHPNESPAERKARKNREAQARYRAGRNLYGGKLTPEQQQELDVETEALAALTVQRDAELAELDNAVNNANAEFLRLCATRKARTAELKRMVDAQRARVSAIKSGVS